jgi:hypothetical protein
MYTRTSRLLIILVTVLVLGGCASMSSGGGGEPYATLVIENDGTATVTIYALRSGGTRMRIGQVTALGRGEFEIRQYMVSGSSQLQLLIDPLGSRQSYPTRSVYISEGEVLRLVVSSFIR